MSAASDFVHLHVHTDHSLLDGACRVAPLMERTLDLGMRALALTDHGNLFGTISFYNEAKAKGIKPLIGCEVYLAEGSRLERNGKTEDGKGYYHMGLLARNVTGYQNLLKLVSDAHLKGFYYKPRTDIEMLARHAEGLIGFTGCLAAIIPQHLLHDRYEQARAATARFVDIFGRENFFVELQDHGIPEQLQIIPGLLKLAGEFNLKVVATNDVHYIKNEDATPHDAMLCIQTGSKIADEKRMRFSTNEFYLKSTDEMRERFHEQPDAITNTVQVAEMCDLTIPFPKGSERYPRYPLPPEIKARMAPTDYLRQLCTEGLMRRYHVDYAAAAESAIVAPRLALLRNLQPGQKPQPPDYADLDKGELLVLRMTYELSIIEVTGFVDYFLVVWDFINWAKSHGVPVGPGRGSGAGCLVAYLIGITNVDPIRFGLLFERFLNPERISPPDFDIDFCMRRRGEVIDYVREKYGKDCVANIITYGTMGAKMAVRDLSRVNDLPYADADRIAKMIPDELNITLKDALAKSEELRNEVARNPAAKRIIDASLVLEGMIRNTGKHAAGIIITDQPLENFVPLTLQEGDVTVQFSMKAVDKLGLLKMDFLGLKTLTIIADAAENVRRTVEPGFDIEQISLEDPLTYELLNAGKTVGVFQLESSGMQNAVRQVGISCVDDINAISALYRPGPMAFIPDYARGKKDPSTISYPHPLLEPVLRETHGIIVYQEQVMECAKIIAGYSLGGADMLRRAMGKKDAAAMAKERVKFVEGAGRLHGISEAKANEIFDLLNKFAQYGFNKSHSAAYAIVAYQTAYLKAHYPVQFMAATLTAELGNADKVSHFLAETEAMGITVLGPNVNESRDSFTPVGGKIRFGLAGIKGVGESAALKIIAEREAGGPFKNFDDFVERVDSKSANKRVLEHLVKTGAFDFSGEARKALFERIDSAMAMAVSVARDRASGQIGFFDLLVDPEPTAHEAGVGEDAQGAADEGLQFTQEEKLAAEKELLGFYVSGHPMDTYRGLTEALDTYPADELINQGDRVEFCLCGIVSNLTRRFSKRDGRQWFTFTFSTRKASLQLNLFADAAEEYGANLGENRLVALLGNIRHSEEGARIAVREIYPLDAYVAKHVKRVRWLLRADHAELPRLLEELRDTLEHNSGSTPTEIGLVFEERVTVFAELSQALSWTVSGDAFQSIRKHPATCGVQIETVPPALKQSSRYRSARK